MNLIRRVQNPYIQMINPKKTSSWTKRIKNPLWCVTFTPRYSMPSNYPKLTIHTFVEDLGPKTQYNLLDVIYCDAPIIILIILPRQASL